MIKMLDRPAGVRFLEVGYLLQSGLALRRLDYLDVIEMLDWPGGVLRGSRVLASIRLGPQTTRLLVFVFPSGSSILLSRG